MPRLALLAPLAAALMTVLAVPLAAQTYNVNLGDRVLGTLIYSAKGKSARLNSTLGNTPLGVFDGTFKASSAPEGRNARRYRAASASSRKSRQITTLTKAGKVSETKVTPTSEATALSDPAQVQAGVIDPVQALGRFVAAKGCPAQFAIYDGRRVITVTPTEQTSAQDSLTCKMSYKVTSGKGHLSPLGIKSISVELTYATESGSQVLNRMRWRSGPFHLVIAK